MYSHKLNDFIELFPNLPQEISRHIVRFLPVYDLFYLPETFATDLETQLVEPRMCNNQYIKKYVSYYDNIRPTTLSRLDFPWTKDADYQTLAEEQYHYVSQGFVYTIQFYEYQSESIHEPVYRQVTLNVEYYNKQFFSSEELSDINTSLYEIYIPELTQDIVSEISDEVDSFACDFEEHEVSITMYFDVKDVSKDDNISCDFKGKNKLMVISDRIMYLMHKYIFREIYLANK